MANEFGNKAMATFAVMAICLSACAGIFIASDESAAADISVSGDATNPPSGSYTMNVGETITIKTGSSGGTIMYYVLVKEAPAGANVSGNYMSSKTITFTPTAPGTYTFKFQGESYNDRSCYTATRGSSTLTVNVIAPTYTHSVAYNANGGSGAPSTQTVTDTNGGNTSLTVSGTVPVRTGYTFLGWSTSSNASSANYHAGNTISVGAGSTVTLYAVWQQNTYAHEIVFNLNGGNGSAPKLSSTNTSENYIFTIPEYEIFKEFYQFKGWSTTQGGAVAYSTGGNVTVSANSSVTLYAVWEAIPVHITSTNTTDFMVTGNTFSYAITTDVPDAVLSFSGPSWMGLNGKTLVGTPTAKGTYNVTVTATYGNMVDTQSFSVTVENRLSFESVPTGGILATPVI
ncbi:MAG: InlB B-repeat-containing protein [archaeon]|nr:InlB B-repeat-containing protein [archaeon]